MRALWWRTVFVCALAVGPVVFAQNAQSAQEMASSATVALEHGDAVRAARDFEIALQSRTWPENERHVIAGNYVRALVATRAYARARDVVVREGLAETEVGREVLATQGDERVAALAVCVLILFVTLAAYFAARGVRMIPVRVSFVWGASLLLLALAPWLLARAYDRAVADSFGRLALGIVVVVLVARIASAGCETRRTKSLLAFSAVLSIAAVGYLARLPYVF